MADQEEVPAQNRPRPTTQYTGVMPGEGVIRERDISDQAASYSLFQIQINPQNPNQAALVPNAGQDQSFKTMFRELRGEGFEQVRMPMPGQEFVVVDKPTMLVREGQNWRVAEKGILGFSETKPEQLRVFGPGVEQATITAQQTRAERSGVTREVAVESREPEQRQQQVNSPTPAQAQQPAPDAPKPAENTSTLHLRLERDIPEGAGRTPQESYLDQLNKLGATIKQTATPTTREVRVSYPTDHANAEAIQTQLDRAKPFLAVEQPAQTVPGQELTGQVGKMKEQAAPALVPTSQVSESLPQTNSAVGELQIKWKQQGDGVAPLLEMRAYLDQLKDSGVAVGPMKFERGADGKLGGSFGVSYDPASPELTKLEGTIQGLKRVNNGIEVVEKPEQVVARRQSIGVEGQDRATDLGYSVKEAFGVRQWDALSAQLSQAPKQALTGPEQSQQAAGVERVKQVAQQQGKSTDQIVQEGKSLLDIDTSGNPVSAFLKNFYEHLNGAPKTRQTLEVDYEKTRQDLQTRLVKMAGNADAGLAQGESVAKTPAVATAATPTVEDFLRTPKVFDNKPIPVVQISAAEMQQYVKQTNTQQPTPQLTTTTAPTQAPKFTEADVPQRVLASMGLTVADLTANGQLQKLLNGEKTGLLAMQASGKDGQEPVKFEAKMVLHREADGSATLKMELPKKQLEIPNEIGGQPFSPEQRKRLETEGTAGLVRGLKDDKGNTYNGYVGIDKEMNKVVILPENKVTIKDTIAGVKLTPDQSKDLREGKAVALSNMARGDGGKPYDGTAQIVAAQACIMVKPTPEQPMQKQTTHIAQAPAPAVKVEAPTVEAVKPKVRGPRL